MASEAYEALEAWESESEAAERGAPIRKPSSAPSFRPRPAPGTPAGVTQMQLEAALARVDGKIKTVADSVSQINARLASVATSTKKETDDRKKSVDVQNKDLNQKLQLLALLPVLIQPPSVQNPNVGAGTPLLDANGNAIPAVSVPDTNKLNMLLPLLMMSGFGGAGGLSMGDSGAGGDSGMLLLALVLAFAK